MSSSGDLVFFHAPHSRSVGTFLLLEEIGAPYELRLLDLSREEQRQPAYLAINPMGKVPALRHGDALITEQVAIYLYLADLFLGAGLAPPPGDALRGPYLRWLVFYAACFEPALADRALQRDAGRRSMSPYGDFDTVVSTLRGQLARGPWMLGERFTAADVLWGTGLTWSMRFKIVPEYPEFTAYTARLNARPAIARGNARNEELAAAQQAASSNSA